MFMHRFISGTGSIAPSARSRTKLTDAWCATDEPITSPASNQRAPFSTPFGPATLCRETARVALLVVSYIIIIITTIIRAPDKRYRVPGGEGGQGSCAYCTQCMRDLRWILSLQVRLCVVNGMYHAGIGVSRERCIYGCPAAIICVCPDVPRRKM